MWNFLLFAWMTIKYAAGIECNANKVAPITHPAIAITRGDQNSSLPNN